MELFLVMTVVTLVVVSLALYALSSDDRALARERGASWGWTPPGSPHPGIGD